MYRLRRSASGITPLARGIQSVMLEPSPPRRITPACAGNTCFCFAYITQFWDHPRLRGEYSCLRPLCRKCKGSPPLARGIPHHFYLCLILNRITPACAGNTHMEKLCLFRLEDHPRLRGEYLLIDSVAVGRIGSPPLARGILRSVCFVRLPSRITPACAGNTHYFY